MGDKTASQPVPGFRAYFAYGVSIRSDMPLPLPPERSPALFELEIRRQIKPLPASIRQNIQVQRNPFSAFDVGFLPEGSNYVGMRDVGEFLISRDGRSIAGYRFPQATPESFHVYLLGQALSFALVKNGIEPLHATVVIIEGKAVAFLGDCGFGKSTLAAEFMQTGYRLLTDDLLVLRRAGQQVLAFPGPSRIKLFPEIARRFLGFAARGVPMNPQTGKLTVPLNSKRTCRAAVPFARFYALVPPEKMALESKIRITTLSRKEAFLRLLGSAFNDSIVNPHRLRRHFEVTESLANSLAVKELSYPRTPEALPLVREAIISDLFAKQREASPCLS